MNIRVVPHVADICRRTAMGDTVTTRFLASAAGELIEDITLEVLPPKGFDNPGRVWPAQSAPDLWSSVRPVSGDTISW